MRALNITAKIWLSIGVFVLGFVLSTLLGQIQSRGTERTLRSASEVLFPAAQQSQEAEASFQRAVKGFGDAVVLQDTSGLDRASQDVQAVVNSLHGIAGINGLPAASKSEASAVAVSVQQFGQDARRIYSGMLANPGTMSGDVQTNVQQLATRTDTLKTSLIQLKQAASRDLQSQLSATKESSARQRSLALWVFFGTILVSFVIVNLTIQRSITGPISAVIKGVQAAAEGAAEASGEVAKSGHTVAQEAQQQASYIEETSASLEQISTATEHNAQRAAQADSLMQQAVEAVERATRAMTDLSGSMSAISASSKQVWEVLKSIDSIAFHTNILSLNAAVEAARAGEAGAGFSVVADEVRSLAQRAAEASNRSSDIIERTIKDVNAGVQLVTAAQQAFHEVSIRIESSGTSVSQIAASSQEQARGISHIGKAVSQISQVTQNNVVNANRAAEAASTVSSQVETTRKHLEELVQVVGFGFRSETVELLK